MLHELIRAERQFTTPWPPAFQQWRKSPRITAAPVQFTDVDRLIAPYLSPAMSETVLNTEPGWYAALVTRLRSGLAGSAKISWSCCTERLPAKRFGSKLGAEWNASTSPLRGSMANTAPFHEPK